MKRRVPACFLLIATLLLLLLCSAFVSCAAKPTQGTVVRTRYEAAWTQWIWVSHGHKGGGHMQPIFWPERHIVVIRGLIPGTSKVYDEAEYSVDETTYHRLKPGDPFTAP